MSDCDAAISASVWWCVGGTGKLAQPAIVPLTVAVATAGGFALRIGMVRFVPLTPIQVTGA